MDKSSNNNHYSPFSRMKVSVSDIVYDFDGMEDDEIAQAKSELPTFGNLEYSAEELFEDDVLSKEDTVNDWILDRDALEELVSDTISDISGFCHYGFNFRFSIVK